MNYNEYSEQVRNAVFLYRDIFLEIDSIRPKDYGTDYHIDRCKALLRQAMYINALLNVDIQVPMEEVNAIL